METENSSYESRRQRSPRRLKHEAQIKVFENQAGNLEKIRNQLGLRPSQICELLKVHPSAWTRWTRQGMAPPHVYQMLDWYLELLQWRGQHKVLGQDFMRREDPQTYVPIENTPTDTQKSPLFEVSRASKISKILIMVWIAQTIMWCIVMVGLFRR